MARQDERMAQFTARLNELGLQFMQVRASGTSWMPLPEKIRLPTDYRDLSTIVRQTPNHTWPGRGPNDAPLLEVMDYAVIVKGLTVKGCICMMRIRPASGERSGRTGRLA